MRITTEQHVLQEVPPVENYPMRQWLVLITLLDAAGNECPAHVFDKVTFSLHPTFPNPNRVIKLPPFAVSEQGWGEFDIPISVHLLGIPGKAGDRRFNHDLNFLLPKYTNDHVILISVLPTKNLALNKILLESGPLPFDESGSLKDDAGSAPGGALGKRRLPDGSTAADTRAKKAKGNASASRGSIDLEKLAAGMTKLSEDDLIVIVQMITDNRTSEMNIKNDVENGEFTMDLFTLPESLLRSLWDYVKKHMEQ